MAYTCDQYKELQAAGGKELNSTSGYQIYTKIEGTSICELDI